MNEAGAVQQDGEDPLAALLNDQVDPLRRFVGRRVRGDDGAVEDLVQESIMQLVAYCDRTGLLPGREAVRVLFTIAKRRIADWVSRAQQNRVELHPSDAALLAEAVASVVDPVEESAVRRVDVERALSRLTPPQQQALVLVYVAGLKCADAAEAMGIGINGAAGGIAVDGAGSVLRYQLPVSFVGWRFGAHGGMRDSTGFPTPATLLSMIEKVAVIGAGAWGPPPARELG